METWEESGQKIKSKLDDFECGSIEAIKEHKQGRARGGMIMAITIKWKVKIIEWRIGESKEIIGANFSKGKEKFLVILAYINKEKEKNMEKMEKCRRRI